MAAHARTGVHSPACSLPACIERSPIYLGHDEVMYSATGAEKEVQVFGVISDKQGNLGDQVLRKAEEPGRRDLVLKHHMISAGAGPFRSIRIRIRIRETT